MQTFNRKVEIYKCNTWQLIPNPSVWFLIHVTPQLQLSQSPLAPVWNLGKLRGKKPTIMRSSEFMDKQITELSRSHSQDFSLFSNPHHHNDDDDDDELSPTFRFHPIRPVASTQSHADDSELLISAIDRKMKELGENLMHAVEGISARLTQLENRTRRIENSVVDLKDSIESRHGNSDGKLRELHNILTQFNYETLAKW
ncbi:hypothetical protein RGQ29_004217 [Quercus rubra]|uniref:Uncharacterized protein n=1 Tax=Quercus rubra TaxID=3512 RepID=A0AAN7EF04_QUERU|nr:hypothetical protein RGQ29_004217 [Quercus rubra]